MKLTFWVALMGWACIMATLALFALSVITWDWKVTVAFVAWVAVVLACAVINGRYQPGQ